MKEYIAAGAGEIMQYIVHRFNDNTIRFVLRYPSPLDRQALARAACALAGSVDVLHATFETGRVHARWHVNDFEEADCFTFVEVPDDPLPEALRHALQPVSHEDRVQLRCILVSGPRESALTLLLSHLCADGSDGKYLLRKLCEAANLVLTEGSCEKLAVKNGSRAAEQVYQQLDPREKRTLLRDPRTRIRSEFPFPSGALGDPVVLRASIAPETMALARERVHALGVTINDLLLTACYYAFVETAGMNPRSPVSVLSMMDLRRHLPEGDSGGLCNLTGALTTALPQGLGETFVDTLSCIAAQTQACKEDPHAGLYGMPILHGAAKKLPIHLLLSVANRVYGSMSVGMTNVGSIPDTALAIGGIAPAEGWFGGPIKQKPGVQVSAASFCGACSLALWGHADAQDQPVLQQLLNRMVQHVQRFCQTGTEVNAPICKD